MFDEPRTTLVKQSSNPNKTKKAVLLQNNGNATLDISLQVSVLNYTYNLSGKELGNTFIVDSNHGATNLDSTSINFNWKSKDTLEIYFDQKLRTFIQEKKIDGITIIYKTKL